MNQPIHNAYWLSRFESILNSALAQHRAVSLIRVDLRFPEYMPATIMDTDLDSAVISRFFASLKAKIQAYQRHKRKRLVRTVLIFTESSDQLSRATDRVPGLPASPGYVQ
ncbi:hypothetical protein HMPREF9347_06002 [Escherichia coli MS 124-1]|uniref:YagK/YfjJ C-terminal domain-containing protein n=1 Tax=Escherichia coli MS 85-1 TaxID=679202 RepID=A0AAN3M4A4_ECOLX|nr:hypothetical protein HMPREF9347_06002 [Escherichia coli MS 124-1]EFU32372.1 hypothetical protein HMPREF9350_05802 [Escherichia coli MS 85-1]